MSEEIIVKIDADAAISVEVKGVRGPGCKALTAELEKALGETTSDVKTREYHQEQEANENERAKSRR